MGLSKSAGNMYEWVTHCWNPVAGQCSHQCGYCYVDAMKFRPVISNKYSGQIRIVEKEVNSKLGRDKIIFVANMTDLFAKDVPSDVISRVLEQCRKYPINTYLFQSKNPSRFFQFRDLFPPNIILCTTAETNREYKDTKAPPVRERLRVMKEIRESWGVKTSVTIEPIMAFDLDEFLPMLEDACPTFVSVGADSKGGKLEEPTAEQIIQLIEQLKKFTDIQKKVNLRRIVGDLNGFG